MRATSPGEVPTDDFTSAFRLTTLSASPHRLPLTAAFVAAVLAVACAAAVAWNMNIAAAERAWLLYGVLTALCVSALSVFASAKLFARSATAGDGKLEGMRLQGLLGVSMAGKLMVLLAAGLLLRGNGVKFASIAVFAVSFAGAALLAQLAVTVVLLREVRRRQRAGQLHQELPRASSLNPATSTFGNSSGTS